MTTKISVIIPTYNRASFLGKCLRSILSSGLDPEVIVVDDGSTDDTAEVVGRLEPQVKYLRQSNAGPATARNAGFAISRGEYVTFLDSDDEWRADGMARLLDTLDRCPDVPLVFADTRQGNPEKGYRSFVEAYGGDAFRQIPSTAVTADARRLEPAAFFRQLARRNVVFLGSLVMRRGVFQRIGGFDPMLCGAADWELFLRLATEYEFVYSGGSPASTYLSHPEGMSTDEDGMALEFINALVGVLSKSRLSPSNRSFVEQELRRHRFEWAYLAYDRGDTEVATARFASCLNESVFGPRAFVYWMLSHLSSGNVRRVRSLKRAIAG